MSVINIFDTEKDLYNKYDYWDKFIDFANQKNLKIRNVDLRDVSRMINCKTSSLGYSCFKCPECGYEKFVYNTCKSRFCNSCGVKYAKQRALFIESKLIKGNHRHLVFTIPSILWPLFLQDRNRLHLMFDAVSTTLISWYKNQYKSLHLKPGFVLTLHTFGRDNKWNVYIHCLLSEYALGINGEKKMDFIPFDMLRKRFQKVLLDLLEKDIGKETFRPIKIKVYSSSSNGFYVRAKKSEFPDSFKAVCYVLRYCGRPCFAQYRIIDIDNNDFISFWYQRHEDDKFIVEKIHIFEFIARLIRHIPELQFKTIRYYGFYASRKHKFYDLCKKLIDTIKLPFYKSINKWRYLILSSFKVDPLLCPKCNLVMSYESGFF